MSLRLPPDKSLVGYFNEPFNQGNSAAAVARFPFPLTQSTPAEYRYRVNLEPHQPDGVVGSVTEHFFDVDEFYYAELAQRQQALLRCPEHGQITAEVLPAAWELLTTTLPRMARDYPDYFNYQCQNDEIQWRNQLTGDYHRIKPGQLIPGSPSPLHFLASQLPGDWALLQQQDDQLWLKGGVITGPASWSLSEKLGMNYQQWHQPVPDAHRVFERSLRYLLNLPPNRVMRRYNWGLCVHPRLEMSMQNKASWHNAMAELAPHNLPQHLNLRVELQLLECLPQSKATAFYIRTYFATMAEIKQNPAWANNLARVVASLPPAIAQYKNLTSVSEPLLEFLHA